MSAAAGLRFVLAFFACGVLALALYSGGTPRAFAWLGLVFFACCLLPRIRDEWWARRTPEGRAARTARSYAEMLDNVSAAELGLLRADEAERYILVVYYRPKLPQRPSPYKLIMVNKKTGAATELSSLEFNRYQIHGHK